MRQTQSNFQLPDVSKSLQQLDGQDWGEPLPDDTSLITDCLRFRRAPVRDITLYGLQRLVAQAVSLEYVVPVVLHLLHDRPVAKAFVHPGDLVATLLRAEPEFWRSHPILRAELLRIYQLALDTLPTLCEFERETAHQPLMDAFNRFNRNA